MHFEPSPGFLTLGDVLSFAFPRLACFVEAGFGKELLWTLKVHYLDLLFLTLHTSPIAMKFVALAFGLFATANAFMPAVRTQRASLRRHGMGACSSLQMALKEGDKVPSCSWPIRKYMGSTYTTPDGKVNPYIWDTLNTDDVFKGRRVVVFSLPGAFTPTCSSAHLPKYEELYDEIGDLGVDGIYCMSVNDAFVMNAWKKDQKVNKINFVPDGSGTFTEAMGMLVDKDNLGFGKRSWRYSMVVKDGVIEKMFVEPGFQDNAPDDPYEVSDAETMTEYLRANS
uniref:Thioredoxin domain-containing protein n=1 Tax=Chromera velia CCMP2878 TaxID=1169474 RepID=A0A0G4F4K1_9ALVE|eukprot:Cvel_15038.t1-p1 / transcript=Cvel_15038.t1 / gene=Cvel_15038 / organism=Chromera_velia_CCMP2878 / gene_product=Putative peroxiredoxin sll1621, putative / transcript_product=Putative peroxiredoxin sll1621, putative / location=Cvel_scaffold1095:8934-9776(+) / protein_length=281 / sequence_SO=supercontig / SO=protein_coding / is_pseudo=false